MDDSWPGKLLKWFKGNRRDLPWRQNRSIYRVWVSEVMLQQTRVDTVIPYFHRFIEAFPTVSTLAKADQEDVLKFWEGLGYYARARNLHRAAEVVMERFNGVIPDQPELFRQLPGVGPYISAAVMSIACGHAIPVVDGNVLRTVCRIFALEYDIAQPATRKNIAALLAEKIPENKPGEFNEAMMELGATICTPASPGCDGCPIRHNCLAKQKNLVSELPIKSRKRPVPQYRIVVAVITDSSGRMLIQKRPENGLLGGLWEFPGGKVEKGETLPDALKRECMEELAVKVKVGKEITTIRHAYTHFKILLTAFYCTITSGTLTSYLPFRWAKMEDIASLPFPKANHKILPALREIKIEVE
ncbi:MAG: A/G-specific adenine glycosylase [Acidobacteria bacterium CG_4_9_14_3_um_filter_49_7]|nr:MAG: A/G-specific adenine glycosylase [Acidobacteria bacterium CG_4_9_14_3_um_filter_49_7]